MGEVTARIGTKRPPLFRVRLWLVVRIVLFAMWLNRCERALIRLANRLVPKLKVTVE